MIVKKATIIIAIKAIQLVFLVMVSAGLARGRQITASLARKYLISYSLAANVDVPRDLLRTSIVF